MKRHWPPIHRQRKLPIKDRIQAALVAAGVDVSAYGVTNDFNNVLWSGVYDLGAIKYTGQGGGGGGGSSGPTLSGVHY